jgi:hypothetical protein
LRWFIVPRNPIFNIYLHEFRRDDDDRALHDHPWRSVSIILRGGYWEHLAGGARLWRAPGMIVGRAARAAHRVELARDGAQARRAISLFLTGPKLRNWGFYCPKGWVRWQDFVEQTDTGNIGRGCGEMS